MRGHAMKTLRFLLLLVLGLGNFASLRLVHHMYVHLLLREQMHEACATENLSGAFSPSPLQFQPKFVFLSALCCSHKTELVHVPHMQALHRFEQCLLRAARFTCFIPALASPVTLSNPITALLQWLPG